MQRIAEWLAKIGLERYASAFIENDIDISVLRYLTDVDLEKIGVSLGHRRKLLAAIAALDEGAPVPFAAETGEQRPPTQIRAPAAPPPGSADAAGERRYLTVMFCDLVGSTAMSAQLDAEEWRDLVSAYLNAASIAVVEMGGHVAKKLGDGLMCLFGYPLAHENDAERAARAALSIQQALADLNRKNAGTAKPELVARIGLESGPAVLDAAGEIYGDVANVAARVQALAEPGAVLVTARVQRQVAGLFVAEERGTYTLKGIPEPTALFRLIRASGGGRRSGQRNLTPLIGRDEEMAILMRRWERARKGDGQLVLIVGEPGLGKSRLIEEFHSRLSDTPHTWVEWSCSQLLQNTPLHPIAEWGRQRFGGADVPAERRLADLENSLAQVKLDPTETASLLAPLLDIPLPKERILILAPEELRRRQLAALTNWAMASAKTQPLVLAFEDLHWADPTTLDVLRGIAERGALVPLYIVATTRPEFRPPWGMRSHHGTISLAPLDRAQVRDMVVELSARHALSREVIDDVATRTGGVPLFIEEVTRLLLERGEQGGAQSIPPTLQQSLMARLDRLGAAKEVAQIGSVIGRGFSYDLLRAVAGMDDAPLEAALEKLSDADIVLVEGVLPESHYRFKHALIQDAAYENLLKSRRQVLHRRVAEIYRDRFADKAAVEPEVLAHHFTQAGLTDAGIEWWGKAGDQALRRSAFQEAISHLGKAIEMADEAGGFSTPHETAATASIGERLKLQTNYGRAMMWSKGYAAPETKVAFTRARELCVGVENPAERFPTYYGLWVGSLMRGELASARATANVFLNDAESGLWPTEAAAARRVLGQTCLWQGDFQEAKTHFQEALKIYDAERDREVKYRFGMDTGAGSKALLAVVTWLLGDPARAQQLIEDAFASAVQFGHVGTLAPICYHRAELEILRGDAGLALHFANKLLELSRERGMPIFQALGAACRGWARIKLGEPERGIVELRDGLTAFMEQGNKTYVPFLQALIAQSEAGEQGGDGPLARVDEALSLVNETGEHWTDSFLHRIRGEILLKRNAADIAPAEEAFLTSIALARQQKAKSFQLQAAHELAKLCQSAGRFVDAHDVLAPALEGLSPTAEFPQIEQAQKLLSVLAKSDDVKTATTTRQRRLKLQTSYGQALAWSKGFAHEETTAAFSRAEELAVQDNDSTERFVSHYGLWLGSVARGDMTAAREIAETFLSHAENQAGQTETAVAHRLLGLVCWCQGEFTPAQQHLEKALRTCHQERDRDTEVRFGIDTAFGARAYLAPIAWILGDSERACRLIDEAIVRAVESSHIPALTNAYGYKSLLEILRGDASAAVAAADRVVDLSREHGIAIFLTWGLWSAAWAKARLYGDGERLAEFQQVIAERELYLWTPFYQGLLAELEASSQDADGALHRVDTALALSAKMKAPWTDAFLHRIRGEILLKCDPVDTVAAEQAFLVAVAIARQQKAKSFELRGALSLATLCQSTGRAADAHAVLAPALEGLAPTSEFPEIAEAQALLSALA